MGLIPPSHCESRSWSRGKCELEFGMWMNVPVSFESFLAVVLPRQQGMESWCLCVSDGLEVSGICVLGDIPVCCSLCVLVGEQD